MKHPRPMASPDAAPRTAKRREDDASAEWRAELKEYERVRRKEADPGLFVAPPPRLTTHMILHGAREYDTVLQRFRDDGKEERQQRFEEKERLRHLNLARDIQLRREKHFDIITTEGRMEGLQAADKVYHAAGTEHDQTVSVPTTFVDYNIVSNIPLDEHHWNHPEQRPLPKEKHGRQRLIPHENLKDFNVISNRYLQDHEAKNERDRVLLRLEASEKYRRQRLFDPVSQRYNDPSVEARAQAQLDARIVHDTLHAKMKEPLCARGRESESWNIVTHNVKDPGMLEVIDVAEQGRTSRYKTRYACERDTRVRAEALEDAIDAQRPDNVSHQRFLEVSRRGHDIISNLEFGPGPKRKFLHAPRTSAAQTPWDKAQENRLEDQTQPPNSSRGSATSSRAAPSAAARSHSSRAASQPLDGNATLRLPDSGFVGALQEGAAAVGSGSRSARGPGSGGLRATAASTLGGPGGGSLRTPLSARGAASLGASLPARAPPAPQVPGTPGGGSVYSRPKA